MSVSNKKNKPSILIVDDERGTREVLAKFLRADYEVTLAEDGEIGLNLLKRNHYDLVLSDIRMPGATGMKILEATLKMTPPPPCILFTAYGSIETAVEAMKHGAFDFVTKPVNFDQLEILIQRALESGRIKEENQELRKRLDSKFGVENIIGNSAAIQRVIEIINSFPQLPMWLALAAAVPADWSPLETYFAITVTLSLLSWTGLARVVRGKILSLREEDYAVAARLLGAGHGRILFRHLLPAFASHIIVTLTLTVPGMILGETSLSFLGLGLRPPVVSWGVMLQECMNVKAVIDYPWLLSPVLMLVFAVLCFNFVGDGLRDAADPYASK